MSSVRPLVRLAVACAWLVITGCSTQSGTPGTTGAGTWDGGSDAATLDGKTGADTQDVQGVQDAATDEPDVQPVPDTQVEDTAEQDVDWSELLDPVDVTEDDAGPLPTGPVGQLYAQTKDTLYRLDLAAGEFKLVGKFSFDKNKDDVTDMALDGYGKLFSITNHDLFVCDVNNAKCKWVVKLPGTGTYNGLTFVPKGTVDATQETLIGIGTDGSWNRIDFKSSGTAKTTKLGQYGDGWLSSGDAFSVDSIGTYATLKGKGNSDSLALIDPKNGKIVQVIGETGVKQLFGFAWWAGVFYGFSADGNVYTLDVGTGKATVVKGIQVPAGAKWWGAGVSTRAAGKK